ncbi:sugar transferase [Pseudomonas sp. KNUC1026]|uniref:sugar transferase n=1 Tax=Pseudomonas sp. KNUC1026 TaxID=2893890 RepID=UPI001F24CF6D|nr:sugar transferase [Pseudomonas sp. KNUC1026]UFH48244.1 sugar transferase [Pseudomonas sp. KNUC1026]
MKRIFDFIVSAVALTLLAPVMIAVAVLIRFKLGGPVLFTQVRPGLAGKPFLMVKFRTMLNTRNSTGALLPDSERLGNFGRFLRSTSLDELPELLNVLKGDMSLVGPRPLLMDYLSLYNPRQFRRHEARPGITGWAQVNGRNGIKWKDRFELDVWYVDNRTMWLDLKILMLTVKKVLMRDGIHQEGSATMSRFTGSTDE